MTMASEYRPCRICGNLTDTGVCSEACVRELEADALFQERVKRGEITEDGVELGDYCIYCTTWFSYEQCGENAIYCDNPICIIEAQNERD
jgi:hypothetical protein